MKTLTRLLAVAFAVLWAAQAQAQTADQVIEQYLKAVGGREALAKLDSRIAKGTISVSTSGVDIAGAIEVYNKAPNKTRSYSRLDLSQFGGADVTVDQRCDGKTGFLSNSMQGDRDISGSQLQNMLNNTFPTPLLNYKSAGAKVELTGKDKVGERAANVVLFTPQSGPAVKEYFDAETSMLLRTVVTIDSPEVGGPVETTTDLSDYREVGGVKVPFTVRAVNAIQSITITLQSVEHNKPIDDAMFSKPVK